MYVSQNNIYQLLRTTYVVHEELTIVRPVYVLLAADHLILILIRAGFFELLERVHKSELGRNIVHSTIVLVDGTYHSSTK